MSSPQLRSYRSVGGEMHLLFGLTSIRGAQPVPSQERAGREAGKIFETLTGDVVEPRREFIQQNALKVVNLDV